MSMGRFGIGNHGDETLPSGEKYWHDMNCRVAEVVSKDGEIENLNVTNVIGLSLDSLSDVDTTGVSDGDKLKYNLISTKFEPSSDKLDNIEDVTLTAPQVGDLLEYDGADWVNVKPEVKDYGMMDTTLLAAMSEGSAAPIPNMTVQFQSANIVGGTRTASGSSGFRYTGTETKRFIVSINGIAIKDPSAGAVLGEFYHWDTTPTKTLLTGSKRAYYFLLGETQILSMTYMVELNQDEEIEWNYNCPTNSCTSKNLAMTIQEV